LSAYLLVSQNFPGFPEGITGPELVGKIRDQAMRFGVRVATDDGLISELEKMGDDVNVINWQSVSRLDLASGSPFTIFSDAGTVMRAHSVIIATGASANYLGLPSERTYYNKGVSACAVCDGAAPRFRNKPIVVVVRSWRETIILVLV
jgi:thioredoxin reductase (NADPH)